MDEKSIVDLDFVAYVAKPLLHMKPNPPSFTHNTTFCSIHCIFSCFLPLSNMANYGTTTQRPSTNPPSPPPSQNDDESKDSLPKKLYTITFSFPFDIPSTPESAAVRIVKNLERFSLYYATFIWTVLFITLVPARKVSVVFLVATTEVAFLYSLLLRALPILHRIIDKRIVYFLVFFAVAVEMILTEAALHLFIVLAATVPIVLLLAALSKTGAAAVDDEAEELARLVVEKLSSGSGGAAAAQPEDLV